MAINDGGFNACVSNERKRVAGRAAIRVVIDCDVGYDITVTRRVASWQGQHEREEYDVRGAWVEQVWHQRQDQPDRAQPKRRKQIMNAAGPDHALNRLCWKTYWS
jgi:hypothetical protein